MRLIPFLSALVIFCTSTPASAFSVEDLSAAIAARDFDAVDDGIDRAQAGFLAGEVSADDMRELFIALSRSAPDTVIFGEEWLARDPDNPKAQIARAWTLYNAAGFVAQGGNEYSRYVAKMMRDDSDQLAYTAYKAAPELIPVSDAIVRGLGRVAMDAPSPFEALDQILNAHPNYGTIRRSLQSGYHVNSSAKLMEGFCEASAESFEENVQADIKHRCLVQASNEVDREDLKKYVESHLWTDKDPETLLDRLTYFLTRYDFADATDDQIAWARETMLTYDADQFQLVSLAFRAAAFEEKMKHQHGIVTNFLEVFKKTHLMRSERFLERDPHNIYLLNLVEGVRFMPEREIVKGADGNVTLRAIKTDRTPDEEAAFRAARETQEAEFLLRRLQAMPYSSDLWKKLSLHLSTLNGPDSLFDGDDALLNAVVFSNDPVSTLNYMISRKTMQWNRFQDVVAMSAEELARLPNWERFRRETNVGDQILCPFLRARLLRGFICEMYPQDAPACQDTPGEYSAQVAEIEVQAGNLPACAGMLTASLEDLWYEPVDFTEATAKLN